MIVKKYFCEDGGLRWREIKEHEVVLGVMREDLGRGVSLLV